jgi:hypothetical protein
MMFSDDLYITNVVCNRMKRDNLCILSGDTRNTEVVGSNPNSERVFFSALFSDKKCHAMGRFLRPKKFN